MRAILRYEREFKMKNIIRVAILIYSINGNCFDYLIKCNDPNGLRIDYYFANSVGLENNKFLPSADKISGAYPLVYFSKNKALFILQGTQLLADSGSYTALLDYIIQDENQIAMIGILNKAPYLVSYFPKLDILYISTQKNMFSPGYNANAEIFFSKCSKPISKAEFEEEFLKHYPNGNNTLEKLNSF